MANPKSRWNPWILAGAAMLAPALMFAGSSAAAEPPRDAPDVIEAEPMATCVGTSCRFDADCSICPGGVSAWFCNSSKRCQPW